MQTLDSGVFTSDRSATVIIPALAAATPAVYAVLGSKDTAGRATLLADAATDIEMLEFQVAANGTFGAISTLREKNGRPIPLRRGILGAAVLITTTGSTTRGFVVVHFEYE